MNFATGGSVLRGCTLPPVGVRPGQKSAQGRIWISTVDRLASCDDRWGGRQSLPR